MFLLLFHGKKKPPKTAVSLTTRAPTRASPGGRLVLFAENGKFDCQSGKGEVSFFGQKLSFFGAFSRAFQSFSGAFTRFHPHFQRF